MSDWNIAEFPLFNSIKNSDQGSKFVFPAFGERGFAVQTSADRLGGATTDMAIRCVAAVMNWQGAHAYDRFDNFGRACKALDQAVLGGVYNIPPAGKREFRAPVSNYADPRRYVTDQWPAPWDNWKWILNGPGEMLNDAAHRAWFSDAQTYTAASWALTGKSDGSYDPAFDGWNDARGGRRSGDLWTSLPIGDGYTDCQMMRAGDGIKVAVLQAGPNRGARIVRVYWFTMTRQRHNLRAILAFVAAFAAVSAAGYAASGSASSSGAGASTGAGGATGATAGGAGSAGAGSTVPSTTASASTAAATGGTGATGLTLGGVSSALQAAAGTTAAVGGLVAAVNGATGNTPPPTVPRQNPAGQPASNTRTWGMIAALAAIGAAVYFTSK